MAEFMERHTPELMILLMTVLVLGVLVPQLLKTYRRSLEIQHTEHLRLLEQGQRLPPPNLGFRAAARTAVLVPLVSVCAAGTVTCFMVAYRSAESLFAVTLAVWSVAGVISLAAVTGGVALMGRLAQLKDEEQEEQETEQSPGN